MFAGLSTLLSGSARYRDRCCVCGIRGKDDVDPVLGFPSSTLRSPSGSRSVSRSRASSRSSSGSSAHSHSEAAAAADLPAPPVIHPPVGLRQHSGARSNPDGNSVPLQLPSFDQRDDFEAAFSATGSAEGMAADHLSQTSEQYRENYQTASASLSQVVKRERRAIERMRNNDEKVAAEFWINAKQEDYQRRGGLVAVGDDEIAATNARRERMTAYLQEREAQRVKAFANLDSIEKNMADIRPAFLSKQIVTDTAMGPRSSLGVQKPIGTVSFAAGAGPSTTPGSAATPSARPERSGSKIVVEELGEASAEELLEARLAQYEETNVTGKIAVLRKRLVSDNQLPVDLHGEEPGPGDPVARRRWLAQVSARNEQIRGKVHGFQELVRGKLERIATHPDCPTPKLRVTDDPANAVRDAVLKYHQQCLELDSYYITGGKDDGTEAMSVEQRCEIEDAVAALELQDSVLETSRNSSTDKTEAPSQRTRFVTTALS